MEALPPHLEGQAILRMASVTLSADVAKPGVDLPAPVNSALSVPSPVPTSDLAAAHAGAGRDAGIPGASWQVRAPRKRPRCLSASGAERGLADAVAAVHRVCVLFAEMTPIKWMLLILHRAKLQTVYRMKI